MFIEEIGLFQAKYPVFGPKPPQNDPFWVVLGVFIEEMAQNDPFWVVLGVFIEEIGLFQAKYPVFGPYPGILAKYPILRGI